MESTSLQRALADPLLEGGPQNPHSIARRMVQGFFRGKALIILCTTVGGLVAGFIALTQPNVYESHATFRFRHGSESLPVDPGLNLDQRRGPNLAENAPTVLQAPELMRRVAERVGIEKVMQPYRPGGAALAGDGSWFATVASLVYRLQQSLHDVDPSHFDIADAEATVAASIQLEPFRRASLLQVAYLANNPALAEEILAAYVEEAKAFHMQVYGDREAIQLVETRYEAAKARYAAATEAMRAFLDQLQVNDFLAEYQLTRGREVAAREKAAVLRVQIRTLDLNIAHLKAELAKAEPFEMRQSTVEVPNPKIAALTTHIDILERELIGAKTRLNKDQPEVTRITAALEMLNEQLVEERKKPPTMVPHIAREPNQLFHRMTERLAEAEQRRVVAQESLVEVETGANENAKRLDFLASKLEPFRELERATNERREDLHKAEAELGVAHDKESLNLSNLSVLSVVVPPSRAVKIGPQRKKTLFLGLGAGLGLALGILALLALLDTTVRSPEELEELVGLRVLACVPQLDRRNLYRHEKRLTSGC